MGDTGGETAAGAGGDTDPIDTGMCEGCTGFEALDAAAGGDLSSFGGGSGRGIGADFFSLGGVNAYELGSRRASSGTITSISESLPSSSSEDDDEGDESDDDDTDSGRRTNATFAGSGSFGFT